MKIYSNISFAKQLIIYLLIVLVITFTFISLTLTNSIQQFIGNNAYNQAQNFAINVQHNFEKEICILEGIPEKFLLASEPHIYKKPENLTLLLLQTYPQLFSCSIQYITPRPDHLGTSSCAAIRQKDGKYQIHKNLDTNDFHTLSTNQMIRINKKGGFWKYSKFMGENTMTYYHPMYNQQKQCYALLQLEYALHTITNIICESKFYQKGDLFIVDSLGNYITTPNLTSSFSLSKNMANTLQGNIKKNKASSSIYYNNNTKYFVYYSPVSIMPWHLGIICPYNDILYSSHKLYWIIFLCLGGGLLFLFVGMTNIVHRLSSPLNQLAYSARQIADGRFNTDIPSLHASHEIRELYDSFRYMQQSIINYIEKLKISTAEKEERNSEMRLARRIQQRFLPHKIELPQNIELGAELRQSQEVGGDLYEFFILSNYLYFVIGDVSGKGTPAALYMVSICKLFRYVAHSYTSTATICNIINKHMCEDTEDTEDDMYVTMFMGILDINTGIMTYTNAGHPYPLSIHENGETNFMSKYPDVPIGILEDHCFTEHTYTFRKDSSMLFYTDGITDTENPEGQFYGINRLVQCTEAVSHRTPQEIIQTILSDIDKHRANRKQSDDLTLLLLRYKGIPD